MLQEAKLSNSSFLPFLSEAIDLGPELGKFFFLLFSSDFGHFRKVNKFPVADDFLLDILILIILVLLLVLFGLLVLDVFLLLKHMLKI